MSIAKYGVFGPQVGKLRNLVFYMLKGRPVCRSIGRYVDNPSVDQKSNRSGMTVVMRFIQALHQIIDLGFGVEARGTVRSAFNLAISHNKKHALKGKGEDLRVNYEKVLLSKGVLPGAERVMIKKVDGGILLSWENKVQAGAYGSDMLMVALYYPGSNGADMHINKVSRQAGELFIPIAKKRQNDPVETYMFFRSVDGERVSESQYLGNMNGKALTKEEEEQYIVLLAALAEAQQNFGKQEQKFIDTGRKTKAYKNLDKECRVWQSRIDHLLFG